MCQFPWFLWVWENRIEDCQNREKKTRNKRNKFQLGEPTIPQISRALEPGLVTSEITSLGQDSPLRVPGPNFRSLLAVRAKNPRLLKLGAVFKFPVSACIFMYVPDGIYQVSGQILPKTWPLHLLVAPLGWKSFTLGELKKPSHGPCSTFSIIFYSISLSNPYTRDGDLFNGSTSARLEWRGQNFGRAAVQSAGGGVEKGQESTCLILFVGLGQSYVGDCRYVVM